MQVCSNLHTRTTEYFCLKKFSQHHFLRKSVPDTPDIHHKTGKLFRTILTDQSTSLTEETTKHYSPELFSNNITPAPHGVKQCFSGQKKSSHIGLDFGNPKMVGVRGFEPPTFASRTQRSNQTEPHPGQGPLDISILRYVT